MKQILTWRQKVASHKRIAGVSVFARANGYMVQYVANCLDSTRARARVTAALIYTGLLAAALGVQDTFGAAVGRVANKVGQTRANRRIGDHAALRVGTAR